MLSRHVFSVKRGDEFCLFNTITKEFLPTNISEDELRKNYCLQGQERECVINALSKHPRTMILEIIATWKCGLRCTHCACHEKLKTEESGQIDPNQYVDFVRRYTEKHPVDVIELQFLGGEVLLESEYCEEIYDKLKVLGIPINAGLVSNLAYELNPKHISLFKKINHISVSVDGLKEEHNQQRCSSLIADPFDLTITNLQTLIEDQNLRKKISIKSCLPERVHNKKYLKSFMEFLVYLGIPIERIYVGVAYPTKRKPIISSLFENHLQHGPLRQSPCCKWKRNILIVDYQGNIFSDFNTWELVGHISDDLDKIDVAMDHIMLSIPILNDKKCIDCRAAGYCWGGCTNLYWSGKPFSALCDQDLLLKQIYKEIGVSDETVY